MAIEFGSRKETFENFKVYETMLAGRPFKVEMGKMCGLSNASALIRYGETCVMCNVVMSPKPREGVDFFPLNVEYEEKLYAAGRIPGSFMRREGRPGERAILTSRVVDRPMRPLFPKEMRNDVCITMTVMSLDPDCSPEIAGMIGASLVTAVSDIPWNGPIGGVQVGLVDGEIVLNPTQEQRKVSDLALTVAATMDKIVMIEAGANEVDEDTMLARREDYGTRPDGTPVELPDGVLVLTCGVDTQDNRLEYVVVGHGKYGETWGIVKGYIMGRPDTPEVWQRLDDVVDHVYKFKNGRGLKISINCVDSGGHFTQEVYEACRARVGKRVFAIKGKGGDGIPFVSPPSKVPIRDNKRITCWLYTIGVDAGKATIMANLKVQEAGPKYCHFNRHPDAGYDLNFFNGLLSEKLVLTHTRRGDRWAWEKLPGHNRNEALDCRDYANAGLKIINPDMDAIERRLQGLEEKPKAPQQRRQRPRHNRADAFDDW